MVFENVEHLVYLSFAITNQLTNQNKQYRSLELLYEHLRWVVHASHILGFLPTQFNSEDTFFLHFNIIKLGLVLFYYFFPIDRF